MEEDRSREGQKSKLVKGALAVGFRFEPLAERCYSIYYNRKSPIDNMLHNSLPPSPSPHISYLL